MNSHWSFSDLISQTFCRMIEGRQMDIIEGRRKESDFFVVVVNTFVLLFCTTVNDLESKRPNINGNVSKKRIARFVQLLNIKKLRCYHFDKTSSIMWWQCTHTHTGAIVNINEIMDLGRKWKKNTKNNQFFIGCSYLNFLTFKAHIIMQSILVLV